MPSLKIVLDTNVLVSAFVFKGACGRILDWCIEYAHVYHSDWILMEVDRVLIEKLRFSKLEAAQVKDILSNDTSFTKIEPHTELPTVCRDVDDNNVLRVAESIMADYIVTGVKTC